MSTNKKLVVPDTVNDFTVTLPQEVIQERDDLLIDSGFIVQVTNAAEAKEAIAVASKLKGFNDAIEKTRKLVKAPFKEAGETIDATAKATVKETAPELQRLERLLTAFQVAEQRKAEAIRQEQERVRQEQERQQREKLAAEQRAIDEAARKAREAQDDAARKAAKEEQERLERARMARQMDDDLSADTAPEMEPAAPAKIDGQTAKRSFTFEVTDIHALYNWDRQYVKMDVERAQLNGRINLSDPGVDIFKIPGIKVTETTKVHVRATKREIVIEAPKTIAIL